MLGVGVADAPSALRAPEIVQRRILLRRARKAECSCSVVGIAKRKRRELVPGRERLEARRVRQPVVLRCGIMLEVARLRLQRLLLAVGAIERIDVREELLRARLLNLPRRIAHYGVEPRARSRE